ncbi:hypothetical protein N7495_007662 [Penicillium taxi]|uniref:uncharacterized protein n=1 Tax=Penicillium taxi TaxID=168475 RepID=UPI0025455B1C|nr:uncharacterized protein N7495_007662 [Penicillium taxi]KAJ5887621.1 hypothetical protein N7495_007662 [Penicillium taxi]
MLGDVQIGIQAEKQQDHTCPFLVQPLNHGDPSTPNDYPLYPIFPASYRTTSENLADTDQCACGQARETVEHFLFRCQKWTAHRTELLQCINTHRGNISFFLGGKSPSDDQKWTPNLEAVRASIRFAMATGRLEAT